MSGIGHNGSPMDEGWIARHRSVRDHWLVGHGIHVSPADPTRKRCHTQGEAWEDLLMECRYADGYVNNGGRKMELRRGEMLGAVSWLANRWNWTPKTVRRFLDQLEGDGMISLKSSGVQEGKQKGKQARVISVCNYDAYQSQQHVHGQALGQAEGKQRASRGRAEGEQGASKGQAEGNTLTKEQGNKDSLDDLRASAPASQSVASTLVTPPTPSSVQSVTDWRAALSDDHSDGVVLRDGRVDLVNGTRQFWLERFGGDAEGLDLALIEASASIQPNSRQPLKLQVERLLARKAADRRDKDLRYAKAAEANKRERAAEPPKKRGRTVLDICMDTIRNEARADDEPRQIEVDYREVR